MEKRPVLCPKLDLEVEHHFHQSLKAWRTRRLFQSAHDCSDGGFAVALAECCFTGQTHEAQILGAKISLPGPGRLDGRLFGEAQSRVIVSCDPKQGRRGVEELAKKFGVPFEKIGKVGGGELVIGEAIKAPVEKLAELFFTSIEKQMEI